VFGVPILVSVAFVQLLTALFGVPTSSLWQFLGWWFGMSIVASCVVSSLYAGTRRLLPLSGLLGLSLVFPDEAPSRFRLALATGTVASLRERLDSMRRAGRTLGAQEAAEVLLQLVAALDVHDRITRGHAERVRAYSASLGREIGLPPEDLDRLNWSALLHDIGKLNVDTEILNKPGRPTDEEWAQLRRHPLEGELLAEGLRGWLGPWADAIGYHHENWDGSGYPRGTAGEAIPLAGRIVAIADVYDVITSVRSYKQAAAPAEARAELVRCSGTQFEPRLVRAFVNISLGRMRFLVGPLAWLSNAPLLVRLPLSPSLGATIGGVAALASAAAATSAVTERPAAAPQRVVAAAPAPAPTPRQTPVVFVPHDPSLTRTPPARRPAVSSHPGPTHASLPPRTPRRTAPAPLPKAPHPAPPAPVPRPPVTAPPPPVPAAPPKPAAPPAPRPTTTTTPAPPPTTTTTPATPAPPPNAAPTFTSGSNQTVLEDAGPQAETGWATGISPGPAGESSQVVTFVTATDNTSLFAAAPAVAPDGTLSYTPAADADGTAHVTVYAVDDGGTAGGGHDTGAAQAFTITVRPVNDAPTFTPGANQTTVSLLGAVTVDNWAKAITAGPAEESTQVVSFKLTVSNPALFSVQPQISTSGRLTYTPKALALGSTTVTVTPVDDGGTADGGRDTGTPRTFTITIV
jgi:hypothetical protein